MNLPFGSFLGRIPSEITPTIAETYKNQLLIVELKDGTKGVYNGEYGMELDDSYSDAQGVYSSHLTKILSLEFPQIKSVSIADL